MTSLTFSAKSTSQRRALIVAMILVCASLLIVPFMDIFNHIAYNPNEGWNAFNAKNYRNPAELYPDRHSFTINNYPPLYFYILGIIRRFANDYIYIGRIISVVSIVISTILIYRITRLISGTKSSILLLGPSLFILYNLTLFRGYFAMSDPQWLAILFMTSATYLLVRSDVYNKVDYTHEIIAALLVVFGLMIKQNVLSIPLAATIWLFYRDKKKFIAWSVAGVIAFSCASVTIIYIYGENFLYQVFGHERVFSLYKMIEYNTHYLTFFILPISVSLYLLKYIKYNHLLILPLISLAISVLSGFVQMSGEGVSYNAYFEMLICICITCPLAVYYSSLHSNRYLTDGFVLVILIPFLFLIPKTIIGDLKYTFNHQAELESCRRVEAIVKSAPGAVLCENLATCYWSGKDNVVDFFNYDQKLKSGEDEKPIRKLFCSGKLSLVVLGPEHDKRSILYSIIYDSFKQYLVIGSFSLLVPRENRTGCLRASER